MACLVGGIRARGGRKLGELGRSIWTSAEEHGQQSLVSGPISVAAALDGSEQIAQTRDLTRSFLTEVQSLYGLPVSDRAMDVAQLVVSELVTNARKYAPGPCLLTLEIDGSAVQITVWDSSTALPAVLAPDAERIGQHGLEIVMATCRSFTVHREPVGKRIAAAVVLVDDLDEGAADPQLL